MRVPLIGMVLGLLAGAVVTSAALSDPAEFRLRAGDMVIKGEILSHDANSAIVASPAFGIMMIEPKHFDCSGAGCAALTPTAAFGIHGSNTIGEALTPALVQAYATEKQLRVEKRVGGSAEEVGIDIIEGEGRKLAAIDLRSHGSGTAFPALADGSAEIGASSRPIKAEETKALTDAGLVPQAHVLALDGILILVSPSNPIGELTLDQIANIFAGKITDWAQLGRAPGEIKLYARDGKSGTFDTFDTLILKPAKLKLSERASRFESSVELSDSVARDTNGIGFAGFAYLRNAKPLAIRSTCGISYRPAEFNVKTEEYSLARRLYFYTTDKIRSSMAKSLLDFTLSDAAQPIIAESGFIAQSIDYLPFGQQGDRFALALTAPPEDFDIGLMREMAALLQNASRMSVTFRFEKNSGELELKSKQDVRRLARYLQSEAVRGKQIMLLGFADSSGPFGANLAVSLARAGSLRDALVAAGVGAGDAAKILVKAYGEIMPVDCNSTEDGRAKNRRVEVWVKG